MSGSAVVDDSQDTDIPIRPNGEGYSKREQAGEQEAEAVKRGTPKAPANDVDPPMEAHIALVMQARSCMGQDAVEWLEGIEKDVELR